jgi:large subunit ribosomal protein L35e
VAYSYILCSHSVRKGIARVLTISHQKQRDELRKFYKNKKYMPLDLRPKLTRAKRRALSPKEANAKTERQRKRAIHFPQRKFAIKA